MMKNIKCIVLAALTLVCHFGFTGCEAPKDIQNSEPVNIAFVLGIVDDETKFNENTDEFANLPAKPGTDYAFISVEGEPTTIGDVGTIPDFSELGYTDVMMERVRAGITADLTERLANYEPTSPGIDIATATELAVQTLNAHTVEGRQNILLYYCGGKSSTGIINMLETPIYKMDVERSAEAVAKKMNADMSGIDVVWYCCCEFGSRQPKLSSSEKTKLKSFYKQLFNTLGAESVTFKDNLPSAECYNFPSTPVPCMTVEGTESELKELTVLDADILEEADASLENPIVIPESQVCYKPDSAEFSDPVAAANAIQPVADFLAKHPDVDILLYGTCAGDTDSDHTIRLGKARAESLKQALVAAGIDENRITAVTVKVANDYYHRFGLGIGSEASVNRKTVMIDMSTELAQQILANAI